MGSERISLSDLVDLIAKRNRIKNSIKKKSLSPQVGIFWVIQDDLYMDTTPIEEAELYGGDFKVHPVGHYEYWEEQLSSPSSIIPENARSRDYDYYPRGRVVYSIDQASFILYRDRCISDEMVSLIIYLLGLPVSAVTVLSDTHYQCSTCNKHYAG